LYTRQGKPAKREIKKNVLEFSGFLPKAYGQDKKELEALEEEAEVRVVVS
jgi:16S rRNA C1402 (ribose-2'-O) methylase RsmI